LWELVSFFPLPILSRLDPEEREREREDGRER
jgi:hypothetical protein